jgi:hypothetical protein
LRLVTGNCNFFKSIVYCYCKAIEFKDCGHGPHYGVLKTGTPFNPCCEPNKEVPMAYLTLVILAIVAYFLWRLFKPTKPTPTITVTTTTKVIDDTPAQVAQGNILNPGTHFPLAIEGLTNSDVAEMDRLLADKSFSITETKIKLATLFAQRNFRCAEVDAFLTECRKHYERAKADALAQITGFDQLNELEKADAIEESEKGAIGQIGLCTPWQDMDVLMADRPDNIEMDDELAARFGNEYNLYAYYLSNLSKQIIRIEDTEERKNLEQLEAMGLAVPGRKINPVHILEYLRVKDIQPLIADVAPKKFTRKADAVNFAANLPDIQERLDKVVSWRNMYELRSPEEINMKAVAAAFRYAHEYCGLIISTYITTQQALRSIAAAKEYGENKITIDGEEQCNICRQYMDTEVSTRAKKALPPHHVGCSCGVY